MPATMSLKGLVDTFLDDLYEVIQHVLDLNEVADVPPRTQVYVFSVAERAALQRTLIELALTSDPVDDDRQDKIRICIGALCEGVSLLSTSFQPLVLSGALLEFIGKKGGVSKSDLQQCIRRLGLPSRAGTDDELRERIRGELARLKAATGRGTSSTNSDSGSSVSHGEIGSLPRVVVLKSEIDRILALPVGGYWNLPQCHAVLGCKDGGQDGLCPTEDAIYSTFILNEREEMESLLERRTRYIYDVLRKARDICASPSGHTTTILVNNARILHSEFMDVCRQDYLRKLFFMQQVMLSFFLPSPSFDAVSISSKHWQR